MPRKSWGTMGALGFDTVVLPPPSLTRPRDPNANEETHYDAIRVGSIVTRHPQGDRPTACPLSSPRDGQRRLSTYFRIFVGQVERG